LQVDWLGAHEGFAGAEVESKVCERTVGMRRRMRGRKSRWSIVGCCWVLLEVDREGVG